MEEKHCPRCDRDKHESDFHESDGWCRDCRREYNKEWRAANPERVRASQKAFHARNPEKHKEYERRRRKTPEYRERRRAYERKRYAKLRVANGHLPKEQRVARARIRSTRFQLRLLLQQGFRCALCGELMLEGFEMDHIIPLARGGTNDRENFQLACQGCNAEKCAKIMKVDIPLEPA